MNKAILIGRVGKDPEIKNFDNGGMVAKISLATTSKWKSKEGEKKERTEWHNIVFRGKLAEIAEKYVNKGSHLYIEGEIQYREYTASDDTKKYITEIMCSSMEMLGSKSEDRTSQVANEIPVGEITLPDQVEDDLPF